MRSSSVVVPRLVLPAAACVLMGLGGACGNAPVLPTAGDEAPESFVGQSRLRELYVERDGFLVSPVLEVPGLATRVGAWWSVSRDHIDDALTLEARGWREDGTTTAWLPLTETWSDPVLGRLQRVGRVDLGTFIVAAEVRMPMSHADRLGGLVWSAVVPAHDGPGTTAHHEDRSTSPAHTDPISVDARGPSRAQALDIAGIEPRSAWDARPDTGCSSNVPKNRITVHHSVSVLNEGASRTMHAAAVRGTQAFHMDSRGYCDIGYHFAVTADGTVWEGRQAIHLGAHTGGQNTNNAGMVFIGCFHPSSDCNGLGANTPPQGMLDGGGAGIGNIARHYGITINATNVIGHRDNPDQSTACPGDNLHDLLPTLRSIAENGAGTPPPPPATGTVRGTVWNLAITTDAAQSQPLAARLPGATVSVAGGPSTVVSADTELWSFELAPGTYTLTASLEGFAPASRDVQVTAGSEVWASIGLAPVSAAVELTVRVSDADTAAPIPNASVTVTGADPAQTSSAGEARFSVAAGTIDVVVTAEGYVGRSVTQDVASGSPVTVDVALEPDIVPPPGEGDIEGPPPQPLMQRVTILPPVQATSGCGCASGSPGETAMWGALCAVAGLLRIRRRAHRHGHAPRADQSTATS